MVRSVLRHTPRGLGASNGNAGGPSGSGKTSEARRKRLNGPRNAAQGSGSKT